ncbi:MAG: hypothetical protein JXA21_17875 [Anaerolineae bacterium]|nr:hypothetical protein [Anaerolineae bacterium]
MTDCKHPTYKSVLIHASAVEYRGKALVFLGPSETGKSTISQLLAATLDGARVLADDKVNLDWQVGNGWTVSDGMPRFLQERVGTQSISVMPHAPLGAIFRLYQAPLPQLRHLGSLETGLYLIKAFAEINRRQPADIAENKSYFASLAAVAKFAPGYEFYCDCSLQTVDVIQREAVLI